MNKYNNLKKNEDNDLKNEEIDLKKLLLSAHNKLILCAEKNEHFIKNVAEKLSSKKNIILTGCGDKYIISLIAKYLSDALIDKNFEVYNSRLLANYTPESIGKDSAVIFLTVGGRTIDVIEAIHQVKKKGAYMVFITQLEKKENETIYSAIKNYTNYDLIIPIKKEIITHPSTITSLTFLHILNLIILYSIKDPKISIDSFLITQLIDLPDYIKQLNNNPDFHKWCIENTDKIKKIKNPFLIFIGDGPRYAASKKAAQIQFLEHCKLVGTAIQSEEFINLIIEEFLNKDFNQIWFLLKPRPSYVGINANNRFDEMDLMIKEKFNDERKIIIDPFSFIKPKGVGKKNDLILMPLYLIVIEWLTYYYNQNK